MATFFITSSIMVIAVLAARFILKNKVSFLVIYPLWGIVLLRFLIPVTFIESRASIMNLVYVSCNSNGIPASVPGNTGQQEEDITDGITHKETGSLPAGSKKNVNINNSDSQKPALKETGSVNNSAVIPVESKKPEGEKLLEKLQEKETKVPEKNLYNILIKSAVIIWISGSVIFCIILIISNAVFYKRLKRSRICIHTSREGVNVYISEVINTPCIAGILYPSVYLPACYNMDYTGCSNKQGIYMEQILAHEYTHIRHKDNIWAFMRTVCLVIYWFNPFVWIAAFYSRQDAELACDETVLRNCTDNEKYNYGKMLLLMSQEERQNRLCFATEMAGSKTNLKERIIMLSNSNKKNFSKYHIFIIVAIMIVIGGCGLTKEKASVKPVNADSASTAIKTGKLNSNKTSGNNMEEYKIEKIFQDFINNKIKSFPEWKKWKGKTKDLYFSIQYTTDNTPCLLVAKDVIGNTNETMDAFIYYYNKEQDKVQLLTYISSNGTAYPVSVKDGEFIICSNHSVRNYSWDEGGKILSAQEVTGYFMDKEKYTYSFFSWKVPFKSKKLQLNANKFCPQGKIDTCANKTKKARNFSRDKAKDFYKMYSDAVPVPFCVNTEKNWNKFYKDGYLKGNLNRIVWHGDYNYDIITGIVNKLSFEDFTEAEEKSSVLINGARLNYAGKFFSDEEVLYFLNWGYTMRAFILRTGNGNQASYDVYVLNPSKWGGEKIASDKLSSANPPEIYLKFRMSKLGRADYDNDGEEEIAFYMTENPFTLDGYKTLYMFDKKSYGNGYGKYELYSYSKDDYRHFIEQVCINFDNDGVTGQYKQMKHNNYFKGIKNNPGSSYKSSKNIIAGSKLNDYNYIITGKGYKNNYEFGSRNSYNIILEDDRTEIRTSIGISFNKKGGKQKHDAEAGALVQYKGNGRFVLKAPYSFEVTD